MRFLQLCLCSGQPTEGSHPSSPLSDVEPACRYHLLAVSLWKLRLRSNLKMWRSLLGQYTQPQQAFYLLDAFYCPQSEVASSCWKQQPLMQLLSNRLQLDKLRHGKQSLGRNLKSCAQGFIKNWALSSTPLMFIFHKCWNIVPKDWKRPTVYKYLQSIE